jgi:hypothetical protein
LVASILEPEVPAGRHKNFSATLQVKVAVDLAAVADVRHGHGASVVIHDVDNSVVTYSYSEPR